MRRQQEEAHLINDKIRVKELRLVGDNVEQGVYPLAKAKELAEELELDLVVISDKAEPFIRTKEKAKGTESQTGKSSCKRNSFWSSD